jgi:heat shock protein HslJ
MSLDVLFTEAAESGGPPRFDDTDVRARVQRRRRTRRRVTSGVAVLVVLAGGALGLALAAHSGNGVDPDAAGPVTDPAPAGIQAVPITEEAIVGRWVPIVPPGVDGVGPDASLVIRAGGTYGSTVCNSSSGSWAVAGGRIAFGHGPSTRVMCGSPGSWLSVADGPHGLPTLYADGLLRFGEEVPVDFVRADAAFRPDPDAPRATPIELLDVTEDGLVGRWDGVEADSSLELHDDRTMTFTDCGTAETTWSYDVRELANGVRGGGGLVVDDRQALADAACGVASTGFLQPILTADDWLVLSNRMRPMFFQREGAEVDPAVSLTGTRWVEEVDGRIAPGYAAWFEFEGDGTVTLNGTCGPLTGRWSSLADRTVGLDIDRSSQAQVNCAPVDPSNSLPAAAAELVGATLIVRSEPIPVPGTAESTTTVRTFVPFDAVPTPTEEQLLGTWATALSLTATGPAPTVTFRSDGTMMIDGCGPATVVDDGGILTIDAGDSAVCLRDAGLGEILHQPLAARLPAPDVLHLWNPETAHVIVLVQGGEAVRDTPASVNANDAEVLAAEVVGALGVEACCGEPAHGSDTATSGFVWDGHLVAFGVRPYDPEAFQPAVGLTDVLDGRYQVTVPAGDLGYEVHFDCGDFSFTLTSFIDEVPRDTLLGAAEAVLLALPCGPD